MSGEYSNFYSISEVRCRLLRDDVCPKSLCISFQLIGDRCLSSAVWGCKNLNPKLLSANAKLNNQHRSPTRQNAAIYGLAYTKKELLQLNFLQSIENLIYLFYVCFSTSPSTNLTVALRTGKRHSPGRWHHFPLSHPGGSMQTSCQ